jgi:multiple sugar transport system ATP-binding protein
MAPVTFTGVTRRYPDSDRAAVDQLDLEIADGEFLLLVGPPPQPSPVTGSVPLPN